MSFPDPREKPGKEKTHKHELLGPTGFGTAPGLSLGQPGLSLAQTQVFFQLYTVEAQFVPGTNLVCPWDKPGDEGRHKKCMC